MESEVRTLTAILLFFFGCHQSNCYTRMVTGPEGWTQSGEYRMTKACHLKGVVNTTISFTATFEGNANVTVGLMGTSNDYNLIAHEMSEGKNVFMETTDVPEGDYTIIVDYRGTDRIQVETELIQIENKVCNE
jgi:hypothetical protein